MSAIPKPDGQFGRQSFVVASFARCGHDNFARVLEKQDLLDFYALGTRRGTQGVSPQHTRLQPVFGLLNYAGAKCLPSFQAESFRFRLLPFFDRWVKSLIRPSQNLITSYAYANSALQWVKEHGGVTFIDAQNSHPRLFWSLLTEEQKRWRAPYPPVARHYNLRALESVAQSDYVFASSSFVRDSFLEEGMEPRRVLLYTLPLNLDWFEPADSERPKSRPLTISNTGALCLRKGTPYLLEAFRLIRKKEPQAVLRLTQVVRDDAKEVLRRYHDLPIDWAPYLNLEIEDQRKRYVERLQTSDLFVFPSIEDGFAFVVAEAMACGLPVITTKNTGASDLVLPGENGEIVPIRDSEAIAEAVLKWWSLLREGRRVQNVQRIQELLGFDSFEKTIMNHLASIETNTGRQKGYS
jgi:glycosyltransferase involved in cell wall biosynthesis